MLYSVLFLLTVALVARLVGLAGVAYAAAGIAAIVFSLFLATFVVTLLKHLSEERTEGE